MADETRVGCCTKPQDGRGQCGKAQITVLVGCRLPKPRGGIWDGLARRGRGMC